LKTKLKGLKKSIKAWHRSGYGDVEAKMEKLKEDIILLDAKSDRGFLSVEEVGTRKRFFRGLVEIIQE